MIFSNAAVAAFIRENFVAAWESVRPVPTVEIDFGNGRKLRRTVNGNIATYLCAPDGRVLDVIPGLNTPEAYLQGLRDALALNLAASFNFERVVPDFHKLNLTQPMRYEIPSLPDRSKSFRVERAVLVAVGKRPELEFNSWQSRERQLLLADTEFNARERKPLVHRILRGKVFTPAEITKKVYRDVLHCDLDDPYLGLGETGFNGGGYND